MRCSGLPWTQSRLKIPLLFGLDVIHGYRTIFPVPLGMASTWDPQLVEQASRVAAQEATAEGMRWTFSPMVDIARDARWGRIVEGAGEDPYLGQIMAAAYVHGYQGSNLANRDSMAACAKHMVGYGASEGGRDYNAADISERTLRQIYLPPFQSAVDSGVATVMSAFNPLNGVPASANAMTLTGVLRHEWGFQGLVVSDWNAVAELIAQGVANDPATAAQKAILAGVDMDMESGVYRRSLADLVRSGALSESVVDEAVRRVLRVKFALDLFDHPYVPEAKSAAQPMLDPAHVEFARTVAERSLVLLRNEEFHGAPLLPIASNVHTIALLGPFADSADRHAWIVARERRSRYGCHLEICADRSACSRPAENCSTPKALTSIAPATTDSGRQSMPLNDPISSSSRWAKARHP